MSWPELAHHSLAVPGDQKILLRVERIDEPGRPLLRRGKIAWVFPEGERG